MKGLYEIKPGFVRRLRRIEDALVARNVSPDTLTLAAIGVSALAGFAIAAGGYFRRPLLWLAVPPLVLIRLALNALDGSVARRTGRARPYGIVLNEISDRTSDALTIGATAFVVAPVLAGAAVASAFLASSTGVLALATTGKRDSSGPMGKADRVVAIAIACALCGLDGTRFFLEIAVLLVAVGSLATAADRVLRMKGELER